MHDGKATRAMLHSPLNSHKETGDKAGCWGIMKGIGKEFMNVNHGRGYFAGLRVTKRNKATVLLTLTLFQTPTLTLTIIPTLT
jgi:hypothetical protein